MSCSRSRYRQKLRENAHILASVIVLFWEYYDYKDTHSGMNISSIRYEHISNISFLYIINTDKITWPHHSSHYPMIEILKRSTFTYRCCYSWSCWTIVYEKASPSPLEVFPKGLFPSYLEHQSESWSMVNKCVEWFLPYDTMHKRC